MSDTFWAHAVSRLDGGGADGIHLVWTAPRYAGYSVKGYDIQRRPHRERSQARCHQLTRRELAILYAQWRVTTPLGIVSLRTGTCPQAGEKPPDEPFSKHEADTGGLAKGSASSRPLLRERPPGRLTPAIAPGVSSLVAGLAYDPPPNFCLVYEVDYGGLYNGVRVVVGTPWMLGVGLREETAVYARELDDGSGKQYFDCGERMAERVVFYTHRRSWDITICRQDAVDEKKETGLWGGAKYVAHNVQVPFQEANTDLNSGSEERALAKSRLLPGEHLEGESFRRLSATMNAAVATGGQGTPVYASWLEHTDDENTPTEILSWPYGLSLTVDHTLRRVLGFCHLDPGKNLDEGQVYDYRITGYFRRCDLFEPFLGFHTLPLEISLPRCFHLGDVRLVCQRELAVGIYPERPDDARQHACRKGLGFGGELRIIFPEPVSRVVLELEPDLQNNLTYKARTSNFFLGWPITIDTGNVPAQPRVELAFSDPVHELMLEGTGFLYGIRRPPLAPGQDPFELVAVHQYIYSIKYENTPAPRAPVFLGTRNLQQFHQPPSDPQQRDRKPPGPLGFGLYWLPPDPVSGGALPWPQDLDAYAPMEAANFLLDRKRVDTGGDFEPMDPPDEGFQGPTIYLGDRGTTPEPPRITWGADLLALFPEVRRPLSPVSPYINIEDVLTSQAKPDGPPPGSLHRYRIWSVDVTGRRSSSATEGSTVRLEKRVGPPQPTTPPPPEPPLSEDHKLPMGVRAWVIQADDPNLSTSDQTLLAGQQNAVVLEWGWTAEQRQEDPYAKEFRVYWLADPPGRVRGTLSGGATSTGSTWRFDAVLDVAVQADEFKGAYLQCGDLAYRIDSHQAGTSIRIHLNHSALEPATPPQPGSFVLKRYLDGAELRPSAWDQRVHREPMVDDQDGYRYIFFNRFSVDAATPQTQFWVGVSAADDQGYITDELDASRTNGGHAGNEGSIVGVSCTARYLGRPAFVPPAPLPAVPEIVLDEPAGEAVAASIDLPAFLDWSGLPPGHRVLLQRLSAAEVVSRISKGPGQGFSLHPPEHASQTFTLANPDDRNDLTQALESGEPGQVKNKFLKKILTDFGHLGFESLWEVVGDAPQPFGRIHDWLPAKAERYFYRVRQVDQADHVTAESALIGVVHRVPSLRTPAPPSLEVLPAANGAVPVKARFMGAHDLPWVLLFSTSVAVEASFNQKVVENAQVLRVPNQHKAYPLDGIRLRLGDGQLLAPEVLDLASGTPDGDRLMVQTDLAVGHDRRVFIWGVALTRDGIPSRLAGPVGGLTAPAPMVVAAPSVITGTAGDVIAWASISGASGYALEISLDGGSTWQWVSPWLDSGQTTYSNPSPPAGARLYRLTARGRGNRAVVSNAVAPA